MKSQLGFPFIRNGAPADNEAAILAVKDLRNRASWGDQESFANLAHEPVFTPEPCTELSFPPLVAELAAFAFIVLRSKSD